MINKQRKEFISFILGEMLTYMNLDLVVDDNDKVSLFYEHTGRTRVIRYTTFKKLLEFCGLGHIESKYSFMEETKFLEALARCKYFNTNMFESDLNRDIFKEAKEYGLHKLFIAFVSHVYSNRNTLKRENYMFTIHSRMHVKALDHFFNINIEDTLDKQFKAMKDSLLDPENVKEYILEDKGQDYMIPDGSIKECIDELIDNVEQAHDGGLEAYLKSSSISTVKKDVQTIYNYYVMRDYNLSY